MFEVVSHLRTLRELEEIVLDRLHLQHAALGLQLEERGLVRVLAEFRRGEEAAVRETRAAIGGMDDGGDLGFERRAGFVEEICEGRIARRFRRAGAAHGEEIGQVAFQWGHRGSFVDAPGGNLTENLRGPRPAFFRWRRTGRGLFCQPVSADSARLAQW